MAVSPERAAQLRRASSSLVSLVGGISLAVIPAAVLSIASRVFALPEQGRIAVAIMVATFVGQVVFAVVVESRLSSHLTERRVTFPVWLAGLGVVAAIVIAVFPTNAVVLCLALPVLVAALEVGRGVSVAERLDTRETVAAVLVGLGALGGVLAALSGVEAALVPLVAGIALATLVRSLPVPHRASSPNLGTMGWVVTDVSITGIVGPLINATILALLGPVQSVLFTAVSTVSGLLAIPLNFMRLRLLKAHSPLDIVVSGFALVVATIAIAVAEFTGLLGFFFGVAWTIESTAGLLAAACLWRAASLATTLPFAALRRRGAVRIVTTLRAGAAVFTFAIALVALSTHELAWVFAALLVGELVQALLYETARRRLVARDATGDGAA
ncbi:MAG: hypothetical protein H7311_01740 [Ramlibacter sp.]|nr:hypothetical protein [Cryobacterium sp.]